jgi:hypothetical protein
VNHRLGCAPFWQMPDGGQAVERWGMADNLAIMQQLGMMG